MKAPVTRSEEGGIYDRVKAHDRVKEGGIRWGRSMAWERGSMAPMARWRERRRRRCHWLSEAGRKGGDAAWWASSACLATRGQKGRMGQLATGPIGPKVEEKIFSDKN
jgi:hypothetical protein